MRNSVSFKINLVCAYESKTEKKKHPIYESLLATLSRVSQLGQRSSIKLYC